MTDFVVVIPSRFASSRLPGKPLLDLNGKPMIQHVFERGTESGAAEVIIATDDDRIADAAESFGATVCMTGRDHRSGTERIAEVADILDWDDAKIVVNLQGDEPSMPAALIDQCAESYEDFENPNFVKVIRDVNDHAIYFSRATIPYPRENTQNKLAMDSALQHHGIYAYRCGVLRALISAEPSSLEVSERLEQLRALSLGMSIAVGVPLLRPGVGVDTAEDLRRATEDLAKQA